jgi:hypothetical protein
MQAIAERLQPIRHALGARTLVMGVLNTTPDSFYDGGRYAAFETALARAEQMLAEGADILDIGGESTRPGAEPVPEDEELRRTVPVIEAIATRYPQATILSIDTTKSRVAELALQAGACIINDISGMTFDPRMAEVTAQAGALVVLMHIQGTPRTMQQNPHYTDVVAEVRDDAPRPRPTRRASRHPTREHLDRPWHRLRQDGGTQPATPAPSADAQVAGLPHVDRHFAQVVYRASAGRAAALKSGWRAHWRRSRSPSRGARTSCASTMCKPPCAPCESPTRSCDTAPMQTIHSRWIAIQRPRIAIHSRRIAIQRPRIAIHSRLNRDSTPIGSQSILDGSRIKRRLDRKQP